mmetsp:Transcript_29380/g.73781  ORF Transcript_29380/g.73781 Transcript_29380/m.73781 type:complete len:202 (-) Transcript_29380:1448-2053(-)
MSYFGAKVLHPVAMHPAMMRSVPVRVKNSYNPAHPGTVITHERVVDVERPVTAISIKRGVELVKIMSTRMLGSYGFLAQVFATFAKHKVSIDVIATSEVSVALTLDSNVFESELGGVIREELASCAGIEVRERMSIVSVLTSATSSTRIMAEAMAALDDAGVDLAMVSHGASKINMSLVVADAAGDATVRALHVRFFECEC